MLVDTVLAITALACSVLATPAPVPFKGVYWKEGHGPNANNAAPLAGSLVYGNGPLLSNVVVKPLYWSSAVKYNYDAFYSASVVGTASAPAQFMALTTEYSVSGKTLGAGSFLTGITNTGGASSGTVKVSTVTAYITSLVNSGTLDPSGGSLYVPVHFAPGVTISEDSGLGLGNSCTSWCAYHYSVNTSKGWVYYGIHPEMSSGGCASGCGSASAFQNNCAVASHELAEAVTDPDQPQTGWINNPGGEIGDLCNGQSATFCGADGYQYTVQKQWSNKKNSCAAPSTSGQSCANGVATGGKPSGSTTTTTTTVKVTVATTTTTTTKKATTTAATSCAHSVCTAGALLKSGCSACVTAVCNADSYCCSNSWDSICVGEVNTYCGAGTC
ncbi:UNVERIFIED_CONTAM: hypothetical protein HDU68_007640 [Siphonaria sp. JEL0065]|nr:hypothetical protein HDU68_007640 [Siphonaria sp. JEL0065]